MARAKVRGKAKARGTRRSARETRRNAAKSASLLTNAVLQQTVEMVGSALAESARVLRARNHATDNVLRSPPAARRATAALRKPAAMGRAPANRIPKRAVWSACPRQSAAPGRVPAIKPATTVSAFAATPLRSHVQTVVVSPATSAVSIHNAPAASNASMGRAGVAATASIAKTPAATRVTVRSASGRQASTPVSLAVVAPQTGASIQV